MANKKTKKTKSIDRETHELKVSDIKRFLDNYFAIMGIMKYSVGKKNDTLLVKSQFAWLLSNYGENESDRVFYKKRYDELLQKIDEFRKHKDEKDFESLDKDEFRADYNEKDVYDLKEREDKNVIIFPLPLLLYTNKLKS